MFFFCVIDVLIEVFFDVVGDIVFLFLKGCLLFIDVGDMLFLLLSFDWWLFNVVLCFLLIGLLIDMDVLSSVFFIVFGVFGLVWIDGIGYCKGFLLNNIVWGVILSDWRGIILLLLFVVVVVVFWFVEFFVFIWFNC